MPFTPLHMGPGLAIKAVAGRHFSILAFGIAQVAMDIEPLIGMIRGTDVLHGPTHTYLAALPIAVVVYFITPPLCQPILRRWNAELRHYRIGRLASPDTFERLPVALGAFIGALSHVALDSIMHADIRPLAPLSQANGLLHLISIGSLHAFCVISGLAGVAAWFLLGRRRQVSHDSSTIPH